MSREPCIVKNVAEYIEKFALQGGTTFYQRNTSIMPIFRGQADKSWAMAPSVYRDDICKETIYLQETERCCPEEFVGLSNIEKMMKMQHYGLPTRLLDFTLNPLVALYFACNEKPEIDGVVYGVHGFMLRPENFVWTSIVTKAIFEYSIMDFPVEQFIEDLRREPNKYPVRDVEPFYNKKQILKILTEPIGVYPRLSNKRLLSQDGVFILFGMSVVGGACGNIRFGEVSYKTPNAFSGHAQIQLCYIPAEYKTRILRELDHLGINQRKLFPDIDSIAKSIPSYFENRIKRID